MDKTSKENRIGAMIDAIKKVARGDYSIQIELSGKNDEFDSLAIAINMMIDNIRKDITERRRAEEKLRLFSQAVDSSVDGVAMGNVEGRITYVNEAFVKMFGYSPEELIGKGIPFIYPEDQLPKLEKALKATMQGGWTGELVGKRKNGELFPIALSSSLIKDNKGTIIAQMAIHRDITESKQAEEALKQKNEELEIFNKIAVGRELKMVELKKEINTLLKELGKEPQYKIPGESITKETK